MIDYLEQPCPFVARFIEVAATGAGIGGVSNGRLTIFQPVFTYDESSELISSSSQQDQQGNYTASVTVRGGAGHFESLPFIVDLPLSIQQRPSIPQNSVDRSLTSDEVNTLLADLQNLLNNTDCASFIKSVLEQLKTDTRRSQHGTTDILKLFEAVKADRGFDFKLMSQHQATGGGGHGKAGITISPTNAFADFSNKSRGSSVNRGLVLIHELIHVAGYDHDAMAQAAYNMGERFSGWKAWRGDFPDLTTDPFFAGNDGAKSLDGAYSGFFGNVLGQHCK